MKTLVIDSSALMYAAFYATGHLSNDGRSTGIIYGFLMQVQMLAKMYSTNKFIFAWDSRKSIRRNKYPWYKDRTKSENKKTEWELQALDDARGQFQTVRNDIIPILGFNNSFLQSGYEADDIIASAVKGINNPDETVIVSSDNDLYQLLDYAPIHQPRKRTLYTRRQFIKDYGIKPSQWAMVKAIGGCTSDTIPGIDRIGEKMAIQYLNGEMPKGKRQDRINANGKLIKDNLWLTSLPLPGTDDYGPPYEKDDMIRKLFIKLCKEYGMRSFLSDDNLKFWTDHFRMR